MARVWPHHPKSACVFHKDTYTYIYIYTYMYPTVSPLAVKLLFGPSQKVI